MSMGQLIFYSGVGLLVLTVILGIIFWVKKPQYIPSNASYDGSSDMNTRKLRNGYPTDRLTIYQEAGQKYIPGTTVLQESVEQIGVDRDEPQLSTAVLPKTVLLQKEKITMPADGTVLLTDRTVPPPNETVLLESGENTEQLFPPPTTSADGTETLSGSPGGSV